MLDHRLQIKVFAHLHRSCLYRKEGARRKKGSKTFFGPLRATEAAANEDAQLLDEAEAVSIERLQEVQDGLAHVFPGASTATHSSALAQMMSIQKIGNGWRARHKKGGKTFNGPIRATEAAANQDAQQVDEVAAVSMERLQEVYDRLIGVLAASVAQHGSGWRARVTLGKDKVSGPTRQSQAEAEADCR